MGTEHTSQAGTVWSDYDGELSIKCEIDGKELHFGSANLADLILGWEEHSRGSEKICFADDCTNLDCIARRGQIDAEKAVKEMHAEMGIEDSTKD